MTSDYNIDDLIPDTPTQRAFSEPAPSGENGFDEAISPRSFSAGEIKDYLQSGNFIEHESGWRLGPETAEFNLGAFNIGGTKITIDNTHDIQENLDLIEASGGGTLYLQDGTYTLTADILIPSGVSLEGVSRDSVIIDCGGSYKVAMIGTSAYTTGTLAISDGDTTVVGTGTTWTAAMIGRFIFLGGYWYEITARTDNTHITIGDSYFGSDLAAAAYAIAEPVFASNITRLTITGATGAGLQLLYVAEPKLNDIIVYGCGTGIDVDFAYGAYLFLSSYSNGINLDFNQSYSFEITFSAFELSTTGAGVVMANCGNATFFDSSVSGNTGNGLSLTSCSDIAFVSVSASSNGGKGAELISSNRDLQFIAFTCDGNTSDGIRLTASSDRISISTCSIINNDGYGVNIAASSCNDNIINAPSFSNNTSGNVSDAGTNTTVQPLSDVQIFTSSGTWTKPAGAKTVQVVAIGGGGGGSRSANGGNQSGGGGGGGGCVRRTFAASALAATETVTVGTGGAGATSNATAGTNGNNSSFGIYVVAKGGRGGTLNGSNNGIGGAGGQGEGNASAAPAVATAGVASVLGGASGASGTNADNDGFAGGDASPFGAAGGAGGGSGSATTSAGGAGGAQNFRNTAISGGAAGAAGTNNGGTPSHASANEPLPGAGGGGGGGNTGSSAGGNGGNGGRYGGGGGGGGGSQSGSTGNGGDGADGIVIVSSS